jgi:hypothetical protein
VIKEVIKYKPSQRMLRTNAIKTTHWWPALLRESWVDWLPVSLHGGRTRNI